MILLTIYEIPSGNLLREDFDNMEETPYRKPVMILKLS
jgi:hypothetical protein